MILPVDTITVTQTTPVFVLFCFQGVTDPSDIPATLLLRAKAFLGVLVMNSLANSINTSSAY